MSPIGNRSLRPISNGGNCAQKNAVRAQRGEEKRKEKRKIDLVLASVEFFKQVRNERRKIMLEQKDQEKSGDIFRRPMMDWENEYVEYTKEIRSNINS